MSIKDFSNHVAVFLIVIFAVGIAFFCGRMSVLEKEKFPIDIRAGAGDLFVDNKNNTDEFSENHPEEKPEENPRYGMYVASANSDIFHFWKCPSADRIKDDNKIWFDTIEEAEETGRAMASDCEN